MSGPSPLVAPGFLDLQCNGAGGIDLTTEPERLWEVAALLPRYGVTAWLPTICSSPPDRPERAMAALRDRPAWASSGSVAEPLGLHLEGPFLNPTHRGAHPSRALADPLADVERTASWSRDAGVALVTLAPELPGALDLTRALVDRGVVVAAGHSGATRAEMDAAIDAGVSMVTHLFNGMVGLHHREPGIVGAALTDERLRVGMIVDGVHVEPSVVGLVSRLLGDRLVVVTDAVATLGRADDALRLADGTLAGASVGMDQAVRNLMRFTGCSLEAAVAAASTGPASVLGLTPVGEVHLDPDGHLVVTRIAGHTTFRS